MRVLLVFPEYIIKTFKPIGISLLAASLKKRGHEVSFFDASNYKLDLKYKNQSPEIHLFKPVTTPRRFPVPPVEEEVCQAFQGKLSDFKPELIAVSASYLQFRLAQDILGRWKDRDIPVVVGGIHCTLNPEEVISHDFVDMICLGEGDHAFPELVDALAAGKDRTDIKNIWFKKEGNILRNETRPLIADLDETPFVDWSIFPKYYFEKPYEGNWWMGGDLLSARGCYRRCNYCFYDNYLKLYNQKNNSIRFLSPERFIEELKYVYAEYNVNLIKVRDSDFFARPTDSMSRIAELYQRNKDKLPSLLLNAYPGTVKKEKVELVKKMNCLSVGIGIESGNEDLRRQYLNRAGSNDQFLKAVELLKSSGIRVSSFNMMGLPSETRENVFETIELDKKSKVDLADISMLYPFPGTRVHDIVKAQGFLVENWEDITYFRSEAVLDMPQLSQVEMNGLIKVFPFYMKFPKVFWPIIKRAEKNDFLGNWVFNFLVKLL